jgi:hypothetical protein
MHAATNSNAQPLIVKRAEFGDIQPSSRVKRRTIDFKVDGWQMRSRNTYAEAG